MELLGCSGVRFEVLWGSLGRLWGCFFLAQGSLLSDNREKLDFDYRLSGLAMFWGPKRSSPNFDSITSTFDLSLKRGGRFAVLPRVG